MTALSLARIVALSLADVGVTATLLPTSKGRPRSTTWLPGAPGIGIRHYASGRRIYIVQTRMAGRLRTVTIGSAAVLSEA